MSPEGGDVDAVALSDDGRWLAFTTSATSNDNAWVLWDLAAHKQFRRTASDSGRLRVIGFAPEDELLVMTGGTDGSLRLWKGLSNDQAPRQFRTGIAIEAIAFSPERRLMAVGMGKYFALRSYLRDSRDHAALSPSGDVHCVAFSPTGQHVCWAAGSSVQYVEIESRRSIATLRGAEGQVLSMAYVPDATRIVTASADGKLTLWWMTRPSSMDR